MASRSEFLRSFALLVSLCPSLACADTLRITSTPAGANVEVNGVSVGTTPYEREVPGGYFHRTKTPMGRRLQYPMAARISLPGYATKEIQLTEGPMNWVSLRGHNHGEYWLLKASDFHVDLIPMAKAFTGNISVDIPKDTATPGQSLSVSQSSPSSTAEIVARTKPAVVCLQAVGKSGSGFFVSDTGVIATNAHLARDQESLLAVLADGSKLDAKVVYIDPELDLALVKVEGGEFPYLTLAATDTVQQGNTVIAIGNPGGGMPFSVTKGIVSGIGKFPSAGPGLWIQTDASINPGNSGGPLLNIRAEVVGINTVKLNQKGAGGIGFALSASDLIQVLSRYYPSSEVSGEELSSPAEDKKPPAPSASMPSDTGKFGFVELLEPVGAEIRVDREPKGQIPGTLRLPVGFHLIIVQGPGHADWRHWIKVSEGDHLTLIPWQ